MSSNMSADVTKLLKKIEADKVKFIRLQFLGQHQCQEQHLDHDHDPDLHSRHQHQQIQVLAQSLVQERPKDHLL